MKTTFMNGGSLHHLGFTTSFLNEEDERKASEQFDENYAHGGGWNPMGGWFFDEFNRLEYPGDPPYVPRALIEFRDERIFVYDSAWFCIVQPDGTFEVARMD